jgi:hypothetical protein
MLAAGNVADLFQNSKPVKVHMNTMINPGKLFHTMIPKGFSYRILQRGPMTIVTVTNDNSSAAIAITAMKKPSVAPDVTVRAAIDRALRSLDKTATASRLLHMAVSEVNINGYTAIQENMVTESAQKKVIQTGMTIDAANVAVSFALIGDEQNHRIMVPVLKMLLDTFRL